MLLLFASATDAMRVNDSDEFATLTQATVVRLGWRTCTAAAGAAVRVIGRPTSLADKSPRGDLFVRVVSGSCSGFELNIDEGLLKDFRATI